MHRTPPNRYRAVRRSPLCRRCRRRARAGARSGVVWGGGDVCGASSTVVKWPFERVALGGRAAACLAARGATGGLERAAAGAGVAAVALLAVGRRRARPRSGRSAAAAAPAGAGGKAPAAAPVVARSHSARPPRQRPPCREPRPTSAGEHAAATPQAGRRRGNGRRRNTGDADRPEPALDRGQRRSRPARPLGDAAGSAGCRPAPPAAQGRPPFAGAFVLYETGGDRRRSAQPSTRPRPRELAQALLQRPPRQPAGVKVPKAKVLNVVPGPRTATPTPLSVSLLRVGVTSELRLEMQQTKNRRVASHERPRLMGRLRNIRSPSRRSARRCGAAPRQAPPTPAPTATTAPDAARSRTLRSQPRQRRRAAAGAERGGPPPAPTPPAERRPSAGPTAKPARRKREPEADGAAPAPPAPSRSLRRSPRSRSSSCATSGVPPILIPIYQRAAAAYGLGPQGAAVLAGINAIETAFGTNLGPSSAGAIGWMQFMPSTWDMYGVDANGDGVADPYNPEDAIFAAASYLQRRRACRPTPTARSSPTTTPTGTSPRCSPTPAATPRIGGAGRRLRADAADAGTELPAGAGLARRGPGRLPGRLRERRRPLRTRPARRLGAGRGRPARVELRPRAWASSSCASDGPLGLDPSEWSTLRGRRRRRRPHPPRRPGRLGGDPGAADLVARQPARRHLHPQPGRMVRPGGPRRRRSSSKATARPATSTGASRRFATGFETAGPSAVLTRRPRQRPEQRARRRSRRRSPRPTRSRPPPTSGAAATAPGTPTATTARARSASPSTAPACSTPPLTSGSLESYGEPGPGSWITIYASATHAYAVIAGLRWDTVGDARRHRPALASEPPYPEGFVVRHPPGTERWMRLRSVGGRPVPTSCGVHVRQTDPDRSTRAPGRRIVGPQPSRGDSRCRPM